MEAIAIVSLVSNVVQFVTFAKDLISTGIEIHQSTSGVSEDTLNINALYGKLCDFSTNIRSITEQRFLADGDIASAVSAIKQLAAICKGDCDRLLNITKKLKIKPEDKTHWKTFKTILRKTMAQGEISQMEEHLTRTQTTLTLHVCTITRFAGPDLLPMTIADSTAVAPGRPGFREKSGSFRPITQPSFRRLSTPCQRWRRQ